MEERRLEMKAKKEAVVRRLIDEIAKLRESGDYAIMARKIAKLAQVDPDAPDREEI